MSNVSLRLIGAETFICRPAGVGLVNAVVAGEVVEVEDKWVDHLLSLSYRDKDSEYPLFSKDLKAKIITKAVRAIPMETRRALDKQESEAQQRIKEAEDRAAAAEEREAAILARIEALEGGGAKAEKTPRTRRSSKKDTPDTE